MDNERYQRQVPYKHIGVEGQLKLSESVIGIVGLGGLGSNTARLLTRAGIGRLIMVDDDKVEVTNLQRQSLYSEADLGRTKAEVAAEKLSQINSEVDLQLHATRVTDANIQDLLGGVDLIMDCTDTLEARFIINQYCVDHGRVWIHGSALADYGYIRTFQPGSACYRCYTLPTTLIQTNREEGILGPTVAAVAAIQVVKALKYLLTDDKSTDLIYFNIWKPSFSEIQIARNPKCPVCRDK